MKTKTVKIIYNSISHFTGPRPIECPHCGAYIEPSLRHLTSFNYCDNTYVSLCVFRGNCCCKDFFVLYDVNNSNGKLLSIFPGSISPSLPDCIHKISPRFVDMYNQCFTAEQNGYLELAGSGYRNALEILIKDYAINELKHPYEEVVKKKLATAIKTYLPSIDLKQSADVVRILGNDYTHYEQHYTDESFAILKQYIEIFIKSIETTYLIKHPKVKTQFQEEE